MVFDNIYPAGQLLPSLEAKYGVQMKVIPFMNCCRDTSYIVSADGLHVFVSIDFGGYCQVKEIKIIPAGKRSKNASPCFKKRNTNGTQTSVSLPASVYGAFALGELPRFRLTHIDGDINNCHINNLTVADESSLRNNLNTLAGIYAKGFDKVVAYLVKHYRESIPEAQDHASESFLKMCLIHQQIDESRAIRLWLFLAKRQVLTHNARNRIVYGMYDDLQNAMAKVNSDDGACCQSILNLLPEDCRKVVDLILSGYTQRECAEKIGCSQTWISRLSRKAKRILQDDK